MQRGEWWIDERGELTFADGDVGDANHEMIAFYAALGGAWEDEEGVVRVDERVLREIGKQALKAHRRVYSNDPLEAGIELAADHIAGGDPGRVLDKVRTGRGARLAIRVGRLDEFEILLLLAAGADEKAVKFFSTSQADARSYALEHMGWIRVKDIGNIEWGSRRNAFATRNVEVLKFDDTALKRLQSADIWDEEDELSEEGKEPDEIFLLEHSTGKVWTWSVPLFLKAQSVRGLTTVAESDVRKWHQAVDGLRRPGNMGIFALPRVR